MISVLHPYAALKPSDGRWLGIMPEHWEVRRLKDLGYLKSGTGFPHSHQGNLLAEFPFFKVGDMAVSGNEQLMQVWNHTITEDTVNTLGAHVFQPNTIVFAKVGAALLLNRRRILTRPSCLDNNMMGFLPKGHSSKWMYHWLSTVDLRMMVNPGAVPSVNEGQLEVLPVLVPPLPEQTSIVRYLDHAEEQIQAYIGAKERLIALLEEERQAVIHQAVTQGLDPNVKLKPSGVEWLGDVPEQWTVRRLKTLCSMKSGDGITTEAIEATGRYPVYGGNGLRGYTTEFTHDGRYALIGRQGALCGNIHTAQGKFWASEHAVVASPHSANNMEWFVALLEAMNLNQYSISAAQPGLAVERIVNLWAPFPPHREQSRIGRYIAQITATINDATDRARRQIELMEEYRTRLIADVVTGKIDVREAKP